MAEIQPAKAEVLKRTRIRRRLCVDRLARVGNDGRLGAARTRSTSPSRCWSSPGCFDPAQRIEGIRLDIADYRRPDPATAPAMAKAAGLYMICTIFKAPRGRRGYADALMFDWQGRVTECHQAGRRLRQERRNSHPDRRYPYAEITRATVIDLARKRGFEVNERRIIADELSGFDECFITGTAAEVTPVGEIGPHVFKPGAVTAALVDASARRGQSENKAA